MNFSLILVNFQRGSRQLPTGIHWRTRSPHARWRANYWKNRPVRVRRFWVRQSAANVTRRLCLTVQLIPPNHSEYCHWSHSKIPQDSVNISQLRPSATTTNNNQARTIITRQQKRKAEECFSWDKTARVGALFRFFPFHYDFHNNFPPTTAAKQQQKQQKIPSPFFIFIIIDLRL